MRYFLTLCILIVASATLHGQAAYTFTNGPANGGQVRDFIIHNDQWFVAHEYFILRSDDEGQSWTILAEGLPQSNISPWSFAEFDGYLYVSTNSASRILRSSDGGNTWETFNTNLPLLFGVPTFNAVRMIVNNGRLLALPSSNDQIRYLNPGSEGWQSTGFTGLVGNGIAAVGGDTLLASISSAHKISMDNGLTWQDFDPLPSWATSDLGATDFLRVGDRFIATTSAGGNNGIAYSTDGLSGWVLPETNFFSGNAGGQKLIRYADNHVLALASNALMKSTDRGETWQEITTPETRPVGVTRFMQPLSGDRLIVGTSAGLFIYADRGEGDRIRIDLPLGDVNTANTHRYDGGLLALHGGIISWYDGPSNAWSRKLDIRDLGFTIFGDVRDLYGMYVLGDRVVLTNSATTLITRPGTGADNLNEEQFETMTGLPDAFPVSFHQFGDSWVMIGGSTMSNTVVFGAFWTAVRMFLSDDFGSTWTEVTHTIPGGFALAPLYRGVHAHQHESTWFISGANDLLRSEDSGQTWSRVNEGREAQLFSFDGALFLYGGGSIRKSTDNGVTWANWNNGLPSTNAFSRNIHGVVQIDDALYAYNDARSNIQPEPGETGLFRLDAAGGEWAHVPDHPLPPFQPRRMIAFDGRIMAVQQLAGYWISPGIGSSTSAMTYRAELPSAVNLLPNYPNPFNPSTTLRYELSESAQVRVQVVNTLGQIVFDSGTSLRQAGMHQLEFHAGGLASGVYLYRLIVDGNLAGNRSMMLIK